MSTKFVFFGATGGCAASCLAAVLEASYRCTALARTPSKLEYTLISRGISESSIKSNLTIVCGDVRDLEAVKRNIAGADIIVERYWSLSSIPDERPACH